MIAGHLGADWPLPRLDPVLRALLRAGCAELWGGGAQPPARVVINEYLDIAHGFFGGEEPRFANGVLDALARALRPEEFPAAARAGPDRRGEPPLPGEFSLIARHFRPLAGPGSLDLSDDAAVFDAAAGAAARGRRPTRWWPASISCPTTRRRRSAPSCCG